MHLFQIDLAIDGSNQVDFEEARKDLDIECENSLYKIKETNEKDDWKLEYSIFQKIDDL